jgi:hypothetical protein
MVVTVNGVINFDLIRLCRGHRVGPDVACSARMQRGLPTAKATPTSGSIRYSD